MARPGPHVGAVADEVGLAELTEEGETLPVGPAYQTRIVWEPESIEEKLAGHRRGHRGWAGREPEVGGLDDGARECLHLRLAHVGEQLGGRTGRSEPWALGGHGLDSGPTPTSATAATTGTAQRARRERKSEAMSPSDSRPL